MKNDQLQQLRYKLQKRVRRLNSTDYQIFHYALKQFWGFVQSYPIFIGIIEELEKTKGHIDKEVEKLFSSEQAIVFDNELENAAACYFVLNRCVNSDDNMIEVNIAHHYSHETNFNNILESFKDIFLEPFYDYLDEHLDDARAILSVIQKYKRMIEWFKRESLFNLWTNDTQKGEKNLALNLYEYLYDQGIEYYIEPSSVSGEIDLISSQIGEDRLLIDAKIFNPQKGKGKDYILSGFNQLYTYTVDYNESVGYLIIFKTCKESLSFSLEDKAHHTPYYSHNNKTIFFVIVDLYQYEESASKRGILETIEIIPSDLSNKLN